MVRAAAMHVIRGIHFLALALPVLSWPTLVSKDSSSTSDIQLRSVASAVAGEGTLEVRNDHGVKALEVSSDSDFDDQAERELASRATVPPFPTTGTSTLLLTDGPTTYNMTLDWGSSCSSTIIPSYTLRDSRVGDVTAADMWTDLALSSERLTRSSIKAELLGVIDYYNYVSSTILGTPPTNFITPIDPHYGNNGRELLWLTETLLKIQDIFYQVRVVPDK